MNTRRAFIGSCSVLITSVALGAQRLVSGPIHWESLFVQTPQLHDFLGSVGTNFDVHGAGVGPVALSLVEACGLRRNERRGAVTDTTDAEGFSLLFQGPAGRSLPQATYTFKHHQLGTLAMFMVPVLPREGAHRYYQVVFNQQPGPLPWRRAAVS